MTEERVKAAFDAVEDAVRAGANDPDDIAVVAIKVFGAFGNMIEIDAHLQNGTSKGVGGSIDKVDSLIEQLVAWLNDDESRQLLIDDCKAHGVDPAKYGLAS